jgi:beta-mannosidase
MSPVAHRPLLGAWSLTCTRAAAEAPEWATVGTAVGATVPGAVHTDLLAAGLIDDPFRDDVEHELSWVADSDWSYTCRFDVDDMVLAHRHVELAFDGLDTLASVWLGDDLIARTANMHRRFRFEVGRALRPVGNLLRIEFASATEEADRRVASEGMWPSASFGRPFNQVRKMACSWGWDWGPWLTSAGVWRPVTVVGWTSARLGDVRPQALVDDADAGRVDVTVDVVHDLDGHVAHGWSVEAALRSPEGEQVARATAPGAGSGSVVADADDTVGSSSVSLSLDAGTVQRWWPHTHGPRPQYELRVLLRDPEGAVVDERSFRIGFRTIELDTSPDATGSAFTFVVNGRPIFVRGVNWIPDDVFPARVTEERYRTRLLQARDAHVDMVRVWGGGLYEDDRFYDLCDELGLLVWQDFAFACAAYPEHLLAEEVEAEARDNVSRLAHHPSLAIWNGNNENLWGFCDWGWDAELEGRSWGAGFYHELLPRICAELDPHRPYWPGSPWSGSDRVAPNADPQGCVHVWDVWNQLDLDRYRDHAPRFVAEFGWQGPPTWSTIADAVSPEHRQRGSASMRNHQKAADGDRKLDRGVVPRFGELHDLDRFWYAAQVVQARALRTGVEHFRSLRPWCMGTIWWQLNDCWPVSSWSVVDGSGRRKPAWHALRDAYRPRLLTIQPRGDRLALVAVNDTDATWMLHATVRRLALDGTELDSAVVAGVVEPFATSVAMISERIAAPADPRAEALVADDAEGGEAWWWHAHDRDLQWASHEVVAEASEVAGGVVLDLGAPALVRDLVIAVDRLHPDAYADRQLLQLRPGATERVLVHGVRIEQLPDLLTAPVTWSVASVLAAPRV